MAAFFFCLGHAHSGAQALAAALNGHPQISCAAPSNVARLAQAMAQLFDQYNNSLKALDRQRQGHGPSLADPSAIGAACRAAITALAQEAGGGKPICGLFDPSILPQLPAFVAMMGGPTVLAVVRHPIATAQASWPAGQHSFDQWARQCATTFNTWIAALGAGATGQRPPVLVRYEDLARNPAAVLKQIARRLGAGTDADALARMAETLSPALARDAVPRDAPPVPESLGAQVLSECATALKQTGYDQQPRAAAAVSPRAVAQGHLREAVAHHRRGDLAAAEAAYRRALERHSDYFDALHLLGVSLIQTGRAEAGVTAIRKALALNDKQAEAHNNLGNGLRALGRLDDAAAAYDAAIALKPDYAAAHNNLGSTHHDRQRFEDAVACFDRALAGDPRYGQAHINRATALRRLSRLDDALESCDQALALTPDDPQALALRAQTLTDLGRHREGVSAYDRVLSQDPNNAAAHNNRARCLAALGDKAGAVTACEQAIALDATVPAFHLHRAGLLRDLKRPQAALESYRQAAALAPDSAEVRIGLGNMQLELRQFTAALETYSQAIELNPAFPETFNNRANALRCLRRYDEALADYDRAIALRPDYAEAYSNRGLTLKDMHRHGDAMAAFDRAVQIDPNSAGAHANQSVCRLQMGDFADGWAQYEWRWRRDGMAPPGDLPPLWLGAEDIAGKTILAHCEQGLGDTLQFCRYVYPLKKKGAKVVLQVQKPLLSLLGQLSAVAEVIGPGQTPAGVDVRCPLLSLPLAFGTDLTNIPPHRPRLKCDREVRKQWGRRLGRRKKPRVGLAWAGNPHHLDDHNRSMVLDDVLPLLDRRFEFVCLQKEATDADRAVLEQHGVGFWGDQQGDFSDAAALVDLMDAVITVDTAMAHLAGAMARPVWIALSYTPDWRWLLDRDDSPWYPSARLYRQPRRGIGPA